MKTVKMIIFLTLMSFVRLKKFHTTKTKKRAFYGKIINSNKLKNFKTNFKSIKLINKQVKFRRITNIFQ